MTGFDLHETMRRVEQYKRDNKDLIKKNANRRSREDAELDELLEQVAAAASIHSIINHLSFLSVPVSHAQSY